MRTAENADYEEQGKMLNPLIPHFPLIRNSAQGIHRAFVPSRVSVSRRRHHPDAFYRKRFS
jgi:hypothetical protein